MHKQIIIILLLVVFIIGGIYAGKFLFFKSVKNKNLFLNQTNMKIFSSAFENNGLLPAKYTCDGLGINPPIQISGVPEEAKSLALIVDDPDAPSGDFVHWLVWNINPKTEIIKENSVPNGSSLGQTDFGTIGFGSPCPPTGAHHYYFKLFALDIKLDELSPRTNKQKFLELIKGHILAQAEMVGVYSRN